MKWLKIHKKRFKNFVKQNKMEKVEISCIKKSDPGELSAIIESNQEFIDWDGILRLFDDFTEIKLLNTRKIYITEQGIRISGQGLVLYLDNTPFQDIINEVKIKNIINRL